MKCGHQRIGFSEGDLCPAPAAYEIGPMAPGEEAKPICGPCLFNTPRVFNRRWRPMGATGYRNGFPSREVGVIIEFPKEQSHD